MAFWDDLKNAGSSFSGDFSKQWSELGATLDKFLNIPGVSQAYDPIKKGTDSPVIPGENQNQPSAMQFFNGQNSRIPGQTGFSPFTGGESTKDYSSRFEFSGSRYDPSMQPRMTMGASTGPSAAHAASSGGIGALNPNVDQWDNEISAASSKYGVPANLMKSIMNLESGGQNLGPNGATAVGPMQVTYKYWGQDAINMGLDLANPADNIMMSAHILKANFNACGSWEGAVNRYYSGSCASTGSRDNPSEGGSGITDNEYTRRIIDAWHALNGKTTTQATGFPGMGGGANTGSGSGGGNGFSTSFGQYASVPDWGEFNSPSGNGMYGYGTQYGLNGSNHTGLDIPMPYGTPYRAPMGGIVKCAGTGRGSGSDGGGCAAFGDDRGGVGRVEVLLDNGTVLIFGHSATSALQPGARFNAGDVLGTSGYMVSNHIHLEARVRDSSTPSGYRIVDPRNAIGGGVPGSAGAGTSTGTTPGVSIPSMGGGNPWGGPGYQPWLNPRNQR